QLGRIRGAIDDGERHALTTQLEALPARVSDSITRSRFAAERFARRWSGSPLFFYVGRNLGLPVAQEGALKMKEISYAPSDAYPAGEMKHGPIALLSSA